MEKWNAGINGLYIINKNGKVGIVDSHEHTIAPFLYSWIEPFNEGKFALACRIDLKEKGKLGIGYLNSKGEEVIPCIYETIDYDLLQEAGIKGLYFAKKNGKIGIVNEKGSLITPFLYSLIYFFEYGAAFAHRSGGGFGYLDSTGKEIIPCIYDDIAHAELIYDHDIEYDFVNDFMLVSRNNLWGYVDRNGTEVILPTFEEAMNFSENMAAVKQDGKWGYINQQGEFVIAPIFEEAMEFSNTMAAVKKDGKWGYINQQGVILIPLCYEKADSFLEHIAMAKHNRKWGCIHLSGKVILPFEYDEIDFLKNSILKIEQNKKVGIVHIIDTKSIPIIPCIYEYIDSIGFLDEKQKIVIVKQNGLYGGVDRNGKEIIPCIYNDMYFCPYDDVFFAKSGYKILFFSQEGKEVILSEKRRRWYPRN